MGKETPLVDVVPSMGETNQLTQKQNSDSLSGRSSSGKQAQRNSISK